MRLFKRKRQDETPRCASCGESVPEGACECSMCGEVLDPKRTVALQASGSEAHEVGRHWA